MEVTKVPAGRSGKPKRETAKKTSSHPVAFTVENKRLLPLKPREARKLIAHGHAEWRGRKDGIAVTVFIPINALLAFVGQERYRIECNPVALDNKTSVKLPGLRGWRHTRTESYSGGVSRVIDVMQEQAA
jgi:hypothetical protein